MSATVMPHATDVPRIGPNAIIQMAGVLRDRLSPSFAEAILRDATPYTMDTMPTDMVDEREARAMMRALVDRVGAAHATPVMREAGFRTGDYLLANRIPDFAQLIIRLLPRWIGLRVLLRAISANAWTFAGSGTFRVVPRRGAPELVFDGCTICREMHEAQPMCDYYAGTFERLIATLVFPDVRIVEVECMAQGGVACRFHLHNV